MDRIENLMKQVVTFWEIFQLSLNKTDPSSAPVYGVEGGLFLLKFDTMVKKRTGLLYDKIKTMREKIAVYKKCYRPKEQKTLLGKGM